MAHEWHELTCTWQFLKMQSTGSLYSKEVRLARSNSYPVGRKLKLGWLQAGASCTERVIRL